MADIDLGEMVIIGRPPKEKGSPAILLFGAAILIAIFLPRVLRGMK